MRFAVLAAVCLFGSFLCAQSVARGFAISAVVNPVNNGRAMAFTPDGRLFYVENDTGKIMVVNNPTSGSSTPVLFATLSDLNPPNSNDLGLHGIAIHPNFPASGTSNTDRYIYVCYSTGTAGAPNLEVKRFQEDGSNPGTPLSSIPTPIVAAVPMGASAGNFGGRLVFGPSGELYVTVGDGGSAYALAGGFAQDTSDRRGKVLRYNDDGTIPSNNPLSGNAMYALGFRNPRGMAFDPSTNDLFSVDSGNSTSDDDEVNVVLFGENYGWDTNGVSGDQGVSGYTDPAWLPGTTFEPSSVAFYPTTGTNFPAVGYRGGVVYVGSEASAGSILRVVLTGSNEREGVAQTILANAFSTPVRDLQFGPDGNLYVMTDSVLYRVTYTGNTSMNDPVANAGSDQTVNEGDLVTLDASGSADGDLSDVLRYIWRQVGGTTLVTINNPTTVNPTFTAPQVTFDQSFTFEVIVEDGNGGVSDDFVIVTVQNVGNATSSDGPIGFSPPGEGGCSTGDARGWWWVLMMGLALAGVSLRLLRDRNRNYR